MNSNRISISIDQIDYFNKLESDLGIKLSTGQRRWYCHQESILKEKIRQEYPSTINEAFLASSDAFYFAETIAQVYKDGRCLSTSLYDALLPVYVAMDIGINDLTVMIFFQLAHGEIRVLDYYEDKNKDVPFYANFLLQDKKYTYHTIFLPHDSVKRDFLDINNSFERDFKRLFAGTATKFHVLKKMDKQLQISHARIKLERCVFNISKVKSFLDHVSKYRKKWNETLSRYSEDPLHDVHCFIGDTLIETDIGKVRIDQISIGCMVKTPNGYKKVLNVIKHKTKHLVKVSQNGKSITCTPNHKIFTNKGLVIADSLVYNSHILTLDDGILCQKIGYLGLGKNLGFKDYFLSMSQEQLLNLMDITTQKTNLDIGSAEQLGQHMDMDVYIEPFMYIIKGKYLKDLMFIILMKTNQIMKSLILNLFHIPIICECTCQPKREKSFQEKVLEKQLKQPKFGMELKKDWNGIENMQKIVSVKRNMLQKLALTVQKTLKHVKNLVNIVRKIANRILGVNLVRMMKIENVKYASASFDAINILKKEHVLNLVEQCLDIEKDVYDLTVQDDNCYYTNEFLVSNSNHADCFQYMCQAVTHLETVSNMGGALEKHKQAVANRHRILR